VYRIWWANMRERDYLEDLGIDGRIMLKWVIKEWDEGHGPNRCGSGKRQLVGSCESLNQEGVVSAIYFHFVSIWQPMGGY